MNKFKKIGATLSVLAFLLAVFSPINTYAAEESSTDEVASQSIIDITQESENVEVSETMTSNEVIQDYAKTYNVSTKTAAAKLGFSSVKNVLSTNGNAFSTSSVSTTSTGQYKTITCQFTVTSTYKPSVKFYCEISASGNYWGIVQILNTSLNRYYYGVTKQFDGTVYTNLESAYQIFFIVNGDFYNNGTTTTSGGGSIGVGGVATLDSSVSYASNWYKYCYYQRTYATQS